MIGQLKRLFVRNKIAKETAWAILAKGVTFVLIYTLDVFLPRYLGPELYGEWAFFFSILTILVFASHLGINTATRKFVAQHLGTPDLRAVLRASFKLRITASLLFAAVLWFSYEPLARVMDRAALATLLQAAVPLIFLMGLIEYIRNIFMGLHRIRYNFMLNCFDYGLRLALAIAFLLFSKELVAVVHAFTTAGIITVAAGLWMLYTAFYHKLPPSNRPFTREIFLYSLPMLVLGIGFIILTELDNVMIGLILKDDGQVALYAVAQRIVVKLPQFNLAIAMGTLPLFARMTHENRHELRRLLYRLLKLNTLLFGGVCLGILATSWFLIPLIYGEEYRASVLPLNVLTLYLLIFSYSIYLSGVLDYQGLAMRRAINLSVAIVVKVVLNLILIPRWGIVGAAFATSVCCIPYLILNWLEVRKSLGTA